MNNGQGSAAIRKLRGLWQKVMRPPLAPPPFRRWVRTDDCRVLVFEQDLGAREGFVLINACGETFDGGKGASNAWEFLETADISPGVQASYAWIKPAKEST